MIQMESYLHVADNSGVKEVKCVKVYGGSKHYIASVGDVILVSVRSLTKSGRSLGKVKKGAKYKAVIVRTKYNIGREDGSYIKFDDNAAVLIDDSGSLIATEVSGVVAREIKKNYPKIASLAKDGVV